MKSLLVHLALLATPAASANLTPGASGPQNIFANLAEPSEFLYRIPTPYESAIMGRRILALTPLGTLSTTFPASSSQDDDSSYSAPTYNDRTKAIDEKLFAFEKKPDDVGGMPIGLMDYVADCEEEGNPTILAINIATTFRNVRQGSNISLAMHWTPPYPPEKRIELLDNSWWPFPFSFHYTNDHHAARTTYSAANLPRFSLLGHVEDIPGADDRDSDISKCFMRKHPDSRYWLPGNRIHASSFVRLVVSHVYWIGGFGDRAYIGWIPVEEWRSVTHDEWATIRLPGEKKGWKEWALDALALEL